jgi:hypothetical protein
MSADVDGAPDIEPREEAYQEFLRWALAEQVAEDEAEVKAMARAAHARIAEREGQEAADEAMPDVRDALHRHRPWLSATPTQRANRGQVRSRRDARLPRRDARREPRRCRAASRPKRARAPSRKQDDPDDLDGPERLLGFAPALEYQWAVVVRSTSSSRARGAVG